MDTNLLQKLYRDPTLRQPDIAAALGCSVQTVHRWCKQLGLPARYALPWYAPDPPTMELGYFLGAWITDGSLNLRYGQLSIVNMSSEFLDHLQECATRLRPGHVRRATYKTRHKGADMMPRVTIYSKALCRWIADSFGAHKDRIAPYILNAPAKVIVAFLSAVIDGDGHVDKQGNVRLRGSFPWVLQIPDLCQRVGIKCSAPKFVRTLPSGRDFWGLSINRTDFLAAGVHCFIPEKQRRLERPTYRRHQAIAQNAWPCPSCGEPMKSYRASLCRACYLARHRKPH